MQSGVPLVLDETPPGSGVFVFNDDTFFPVEVFTFTGDDDVFVFVNGKLALDGDRRLDRRGRPRDGGRAPS